MPKKIRVYELARELGLTNKEALDLALGLGIGVKSHSSSIEDAQADRVRRKADREGLRRPVQPDEEAAAAPAGAQAPPAAASPAAAGTRRDGAATRAPERPPTDAVLPRGDDLQVATAAGPLPDAGRPLSPSPAGSQTAGQPAPPGSASPTAGGQVVAPAASAAGAGVPGTAAPGAGAAATTAAAPATSAGAPAAEAPRGAPPSGAGAAPSSAASPQVARGSEPASAGGSSHDVAGRAASPEGAPPQSRRPDHLVVSRPASEVVAPARPAPARPAATESGRGTAAAPSGSGPSHPAAPGSGHASPGQAHPAGPGQAPPAGPGQARPAAPGQAHPAPGQSQPGPGQAHLQGAGGVAAAAASAGAPAAPPGSAAAPQEGAAAPAGARPAAPPGSPEQGAPRPPRRPVLGASGKPIPPPPGGPPRSMSGRPIPPPPGMGGRGPAAGPPRPSGGPPRGGSGPRPGGGASRSGGFSTGAPRVGGSGGPRPGGFGGQRSGGGLGTGGGGLGRGAPGGPPAPGGIRGGPGGRGRPPQRRTQRRRRNVEELEPIQVATYVPSNAPVPDHEVIVERGCTPQDLGLKLNRSAGDVIRFLLLQGEMVTATQSLSDDMIELFAAEIGAQVRLVDPGEEQEAALQARYFGDDDAEAGDPEMMRPRPPVVTVMGHVDHGKTLLLDRIRETHVAAGEAGGITQHIGAYQVDWQDHLVTFIDTPGHEAFTAMRARGAEVTDIVVLVVAADDGVMPQTIEAIDHARAADVPIVVAVNKIDRADADPTRVMQQLSEHGLIPEAWGGDTITVEVSALERLGIDDLLEHLVVLAEVLELKANPEGRAKGVVLEANLDIGRGPVATVIVQSGTLRVGDTIVAGPAWGRVKALVDDRGEPVKEAPPAMPVEVLGLSEPPSAGDELRATVSLSMARTIGEARQQRLRFAGYSQVPVAPAAGAKLEDIFDQIQRGETATLNIVLKADVQGSLEAVTESLRKLERDEVKISFVRRAVGGITESDVELAAASSSTIIGFNVRPDRRARELAEAQGVEIRSYEIIYKLVEEIELAMVGMLAPSYEEVVTGDAEVRAVFRVPRVGAVAGCLVRSGTITRGSKVRFLREGVVIWKGAVSSLRRFKDDVREVNAGFECGIGLTDFQDLKEGDVIETYEEREVPRT